MKTGALIKSGPASMRRNSMLYMPKTGELLGWPTRQAGSRPPGRWKQAQDRHHLAPGADSVGLRRARQRLYVVRGKDVEDDTSAWPRSIRRRQAYGGDPSSTATTPRRWPSEQRTGDTHFIQPDTEPACFGGKSGSNKKTHALEDRGRSPRPKKRHDRHGREGPPAVRGSPESPAKLVVSTPPTARRPGLRCADAGSTRLLVGPTIDPGGGSMSAAAEPFCWWWSRTTAEQYRAIAAVGRRNAGHEKNGHLRAC